MSDVKSAVASVLLEKGESSRRINPSNVNSLGNSELRELFVLIKQLEVAINDSLEDRGMMLCDRCFVHYRADDVVGGLCVLCDPSRPLNLD